MGDQPGALPGDAAGQPMVNVFYAVSVTKTVAASAPGAERRNGRAVGKNISIMFVIEVLNESL